MRNSSTLKNNRLLKPWALTGAAVAVSGLLWGAFQSEDVFQPDGREPDFVSANYAELLLAARPDDHQLRMRLIDLLIRLGDYPKARRYLKDWAAPQPQLQAFYALKLDVAEQNTHAADPRHLLDQLKGIDHHNLPLPQQQELASLALAMQAPAYAASVYEDIAARDPAQRDASRLAAAQWYLAGEQPERAADIYVQMRDDQTAAPERRTYARQAFDSFLAANRGEQAAQVLADELERLDDPQADAAWLEQGITTAVQSRRFDLAQRMLDRWRILQPDNPHILTEEFNVRLAFGDLEGAWASGQQLLAANPNDLQLLEKMAHLGEWRNDPAAALDLWLRLLERQDTRQTREHAWQLASQQADFEKMIPLLEDIMQQRALTDAELDALLYAYEAQEIQPPENQAAAWLTDYTERYPEHRHAWTRLLQNLENSKAYAAKAQVYTRLSERFELTPAERVDWAIAYLNVNDKQAAWTVLQGGNQTATDEAYWRLRATLAWDLKFEDQLRVSLEKLLLLKGSLDAGDESQLITLYEASDPQKALDLALASWRRSRDPQRLVQILQQNERRNDWAQVAAVLEEAEQYPDSLDQAQVLAIRGTLATRLGDFDEARRLYLMGQALFPDESLFRERLIWLYLDHGRTDELKPLLAAWQTRARQDPRLWLPFASASQMLGRSNQAMAWYRLYLKEHPEDWLVQAAYADALYNAGYVETAQRLRLVVLRNLEAKEVQPATQHYAVWLRLMAASYSSRLAERKARPWREGSQPLLSLWFERLLANLDATNQSSQKDQWLKWAQEQGLQVDRYEHIQKVLRRRNQAQLQALLSRTDLNPAVRAEVLISLGRLAEAQDTSLSALGQDQPASVREQLRRQAVLIQERMPQGAKLSWQEQDYGGLEFNAARVQAAHTLFGQWHADVQLEQGTYSSDQLISSRLGEERNAQITLQRHMSDGRYTLAADTSQRKDDDRTGLSIARTWEASARDTFQGGIDWQRKSEESGLMRTFGQYDGLWLSGRHGLTARDQVRWQVAGKSFSTRDGDSLGTGHALTLEYSHRVQFADPSWVVRTGVDYQRNRVKDRALDSLSARNGGAVTNADGSFDRTVLAKDLLQSRYGQLYVASTWSRGLPGSLNRSTPQYTWLVDVMAGWQWTDQTFNYGINTGIGMAVLGNDQLALTIGYQSAPQGGNGEAGGTLAISYGMRFGR